MVVNKTYLLTAFNAYAIVCHVSIDYLKWHGVIQLIQRFLSVNCSQNFFRIVLLASLISAIFQVSLGGVVRVTQSGLGCPDWPLCHGQIVPPIEAASLIEFSHRLSAALLAILVLTATIAAWKIYRSYSRPTISILVTFILVLCAAVLGAVSVITELAWWAVLVHLAIAELVIAFLVITFLFSQVQDTRNLESDLLTKFPRWMNMYVGLTVFLTFLLILTGSYMVGLGYGSACATWPLCKGAILPDGAPFIIHMFHRILGGIVTLLVVGIVVTFYTKGLRNGKLDVAVVLLFGSFVFQILIGAVIIWTGFDIWVRSIHLTMATLSWTFLVLVAGIYFMIIRLDWNMNITSSKM